MTDLTLDELRKLTGGARVLVRWKEQWGYEVERPYMVSWRGGLLWALGPQGSAERVLCWSASAKPSEKLEHKVRKA